MLEIRQLLHVLEFESLRLRHIVTPTEPAFSGLCRFWGLGNGAAGRPWFPQSEVPQSQPPSRCDFSPPPQPRSMSLCV